MSQEYSAVTLAGNGRLSVLITEVEIGFPESLAKIFGKSFSTTKIKYNI